jgi:ferredoxin-NADP reductase
LRNAEGAVRSYSLTSVPGLGENLAIHIKRLRGGQMSTWAFECAASGEAIGVQGPQRRFPL